ncbi:germination protein YpeB [Alteribacillus sp. HJP-4]
MIRTIIIAVLVLALVGTGFWGVSQANENEALKNSTENNYQRAFHDLAFHLDQLEDEVGSTLAMNSRKQLSSSMAEVWRITSLAQSELGQLPLGIMNLNETEELLYNIGDFSYNTSVRDLEDEPLTDKEYKRLEKFYNESGEIKNDLRKLQASTLKENWKWNDAETAMNMNDNPEDNSIVNGFQLIDEKVKGYAETDWGAENGFTPDVDEKLAETLSGKEYTEEEAVEKAKEFIGLPDDMEATVEPLGEGVAYEGYSMKIKEPEGEADISLDMTKKGGHPLWFLQSRPIDEPEISLNEASEKAAEFLDRNGFENMQVLDSKQYDTVGTFLFAPVVDNTRIYPDSVMMEIALDDGEVVGFKGADYVANHRDRGEFTPAITEEEAKEKVNPKVDIMESSQALIFNKADKEVLCYEFIGRLNDDTFKIYINADNGDEELVQKMSNAEPVYDTM